MLLASGLNYGFRRTVPHVVGISFGCVAMLFLVGLGLGEVFAAAPLIYVALRYVGAAYLLWLAWQIARPGPMEPGRNAGKPMTFWQPAGFQWVNPKAWIIVVGAISTYARPGGLGANVLEMCVMFGLMNMTGICVWAGCGTALRPLLSDPGRLRAFNVTMAVLLVLSLLPMLGH